MAKAKLKTALEIASNPAIAEIRFHGKRLLMVGGAITTKERYETFGESLCHLFSDGVILQHGKKIGRAKDITVLKVLKGT